MVYDDVDLSINELVIDLPVCKSSRVFRLSVRLNDYDVTLNYTSVKYFIQNVCSAGLNLFSKFLCFMSNLDKVRELEYVTEAFNDPNWKLAMDSKMNALISVPKLGN